MVSTGKLRCFISLGDLQSVLMKRFEHLVGESVKSTSGSAGFGEKKEFPEVRKARIHIAIPDFQ
jgi:hypothetical protein